MTCGQYSIANLSEKELQKLKEAEKSLATCTNSKTRGQNEQEIVLIAYTHGHK